MKVLILGASGQIGKEIYNYFSLDRSIHVVGTTRKTIADLVTFDPFKDPWSALGTFDVVVNCIGQIYPTNEFSFKRIHVDTTCLIIKHRHVLGNPKIIQISALGATEDHSANFLSTKAYADSILLKESNTYVVRPSIVCTPGTMLSRKLRMMYKIAKYSGGYLFLPKGFLNSKIQPIMPEDLSNIIYHLCKGNCNNSIIPAVGPEEISYRSMIDLLFQVNGKKYKSIEINRNILRKLLKPVFKFFPHIISEEQFKLLFYDNTSSSEISHRLIEQPLNSTLEFWKKELKY